MKHLLLALILLPSAAYAHCPISIEINGEKYCTNINWLPSDTKVQGQYQESTLPSPHLIPSGEVPQKWAYSKAEFLIWKNGDHSHTPQAPKGFRIFPYMVMENGMHHSAGNTFSWDEKNGVFVIEHLALQSMKGCWSLRWTTNATDDFATSHLLTNIVGYMNLNAADNAVMTQYCETLTTDTPPAEGGHHQHH